jgi:3-methyladenine DNA glycosylase AlkC
MTTTKRVGATRRDRISADVLAQLNAGSLETATLAEWLAVDMERLLWAVADTLGLKHAEDELRRSAQGVNLLGVTRRLERIGRAIFLVSGRGRQRESILRRVALHQSDVVRQWGAYAVLADDAMDLTERVVAIRRFASDRNMSVRECAWMAFRPFVVARTADALKLLMPLAHDTDPNVRRFASEVSRPRSVWCVHIPLLKRHPNLARELLEPLKNDPSRYVQLSVGNWLNDAGKSRPDWVTTLCDEWRRTSDDVAATRHIMRRALRSIREGRRGSLGLETT